MDNFCKPCESYKFGQNCSETCICSTDNSLGCDSITGVCKCKQGWKGKCYFERINLVINNNNNNVGTNCETQYSEDTYDQNSTKECNCQNGASCQETGKCECLPGWYGESCQLPCQKGYYGKDCKQKCLLVNAGKEYLLYVLFFN